MQLVLGLIIGKIREIVFLILLWIYVFYEKIVKSNYEPRCGNYRNLLSLFWQKFCESNVVTKEIDESLFQCVKFWLFHSVRNLIQGWFHEKFVILFYSTFFEFISQKKSWNRFTELMYIIHSWFHEKFIKCFTQLTVWKLRKFTLTLFWQNFRENNDFTI